MLTGLGANAALAVVDRQGEALKARFAARRDNQADATRLREAASRITDAEALLKDRRTLQVVLEAFQLESEINKRSVLQRVLTEDPADKASLVNRLPDPRWKAMAEALATARALNVSPAALAETPVEEIVKLDLGRMAGLDFLQVQALTEEQVKAFTPDQIGAISAEAIGGLDAKEIAALSREQVAALKPVQTRALLAWQVAGIEPEDMPFLSPAALRAMQPEQLTMFTPQQMAAMTEEQLGAFTGRQAGAFLDDQLAALTDRGRAILSSAPFLPDEPPTAARGPLSDPRVVERVIKGAMTNRFEKAMGEAAPGLREALYFRRMAPNVTTLPQLMSDRALLEVTRGALGIPATFSSLDFEQQRDLLAKRLDISKLQDPKEVARMAGRYVAGLAQTGGTQDPLVALLGGGGGVESLPALAARGISLRF